MIVVRCSISVVTRQMIYMALFQILAVLLFNGPYTVGQIYSISTANLTKDAYRKAQGQLVNSFFAIYGYGPYVVGNVFFPSLTITSCYCFVVLEFFLLLLYNETISRSTTLHNQKVHLL